MHWAPAMGWALGQLPFGTAQNTQLTWQAACERCPATALPASVSLLRFLQFQKVIPLLCVCVFEALVPSRDSRAMTCSPSPRAWRPDFPGAT